MKRTTRTTGTVLMNDEAYDLRGLNLIAPDQIMPKGESPKADNSRMYAREDNQARVAIRTRKGSRRSSTPVGEALNVQNVASPSGGDALVSATNWIAQPFVPSSTGALTKLEMEVRLVTAGLGHLLVHIYTDVSGNPGVKVAEGAILEGAVAPTTGFLPAYFIDAPALTSGVTYWVLLKVQTNGTAVYALNKTAATGAKTTVNPGTIFTAAGYTVRYKTYLSTSGSILGFARRYPSNKINRTLVAMGVNLYSITDAGAATVVSSAIGGATKKVRFDQVDDKTFWVDGTTPAKYWDGTTVATVGGIGGTPSNLIVHQNRLFLVDPLDPTKVVFSDLFSFGSYPSTNFFYVPSPKSPDPVSAWRVFQGNLTIFTRESKHILYGTDLSSFTRRQATETKGAISQEATAADRDYIYFMADDRQVYRYNGSTDELLSEKVEPILKGIQNLDTVSFHLYNNQLRIYFAAGTDSAASNMLLLELSTKESNKHLQWFYDTGRLVMGSLEWDLDQNQLIEFSSKTGAFFLGETDESDLGKPIAFKYWTSYLSYGSGSAKDRVNNFRPYLRSSGVPLVMRIGKDIDFINKPTLIDYAVNPTGAVWGGFSWNDGSLWGSNVQMIQNKVSMSGRGNFTQYRFECDQAEAPVQLYGYFAMIKSGRPR